jgi:hypothetical protein
MYVECVDTWKLFIKTKEIVLVKNELIDKDRILDAKKTYRAISELTFQKQLLKAGVS